MKRLLKFALPFMVCAVTLAACTTPSLTQGEGYIETSNGKVWYRIVGSGNKTPLLLLHGGPGSTSYYLNPLAALANERPVIFYDQLGCGRSDKTSDSTLWTIEHFVAEVAQVREALGLKKVHLLGHSWGSMLAVDYMLTKPEGVQSLVLSSPVMSVKRWLRDADSLRAVLPDSIRVALVENETAGTMDSEAYQAAVIGYYKQYVIRGEPWSADIDSTLASSNDAIYNYMWGPTEFFVTGTLQNYERVNRLQEISIPVLFTAGQHDEATPSAAKYFSEMTPNARFEQIDNSAHLTMHDAPEQYLSVLRAFLHEIDQK